jgi:DNA-binding FadR family transcriptional regulator
MNLLLAERKWNQAVPRPADFHEQLVKALLTRDPAIADKKMHEHLHYRDSKKAKLRKKT